MQSRQRRILVGTRNRLRVGEKIIELDPRRHCRRAAVTRHDKCATGVGVSRTRVVVLATHPAGQESGGERVAGAQHVQYFDFNTAAVERVVERARNFAVDNRATHRTALDDQHSLGMASRRGKRMHDVGAAARDVEFLDRADDEIELRQQALQMRRYGVRFNVTRFAIPALGEAPQHGPIIDVEDCPYVVLARAVEREIADPIDVFGREMRAGDKQRAALGDVRFVDFGFADRHVRAVLAQEDKRKRVLVLDAQHDSRRQSCGVDTDMADVAAFAGDRLDEEAAHRVVADARDQPGLEPEPRATKRGIRRGAAEIFREARHVLQSRADLLRVEVDAEASEADDVERATGGETDLIAHELLDHEVVDSRAPLDASNTWMALAATSQRTGSPGARVCVRSTRAHTRVPPTSRYTYVSGPSGSTTLTRAPSG